MTRGDPPRKRPIELHAPAGREHGHPVEPTGFYVPPADPEALRQAIVYLLDHPEERARLGAAGRRAVEAAVHRRPVRRAHAGPGGRGSPPAVPEAANPRRLVGAHDARQTRSEVRSRWAWPLSGSGCCLMTRCTSSSSPSWRCSAARTAPPAGGRASAVRHPRPRAQRGGAHRPPARQPEPARLPARPPTCTSSPTTAPTRTAAVRACAGRACVRALRRHERAKGFALRWLHAADRGYRAEYDAFVVLDADSVVSPNFLRAMDARLDRRRQAMQAYYSVLNASRLARGRAALRGARRGPLPAAARPLGLGLSCGLKGNGMCFSADVLRRFSWRWFTLAEDVEFHLALVKAGMRVDFAPETTVLADMPVTWRRPPARTSAGSAGASSCCAARDGRSWFRRCADAASYLWMRWSNSLSRRCPFPSCSRSCASRWLFRWARGSPPGSQPSA